MKKLIIAAGLALAVLAGAGPALAAHPIIITTIPADCTQYSGSTNGNNWPFVPSGKGYMYYCKGATLAHAADVFGVISANNNANFITTKMASDGGIFFLYPNEADAYNDLKSYGLTVQPAGVNGVTYVKSNVPQYSVIFENNGIYDQNDLQIDSVTAHELGHWLDYLDASVLGSSTVASASSLFGHSITASPGGDWYTFNRVTPCNSADTGLFNGAPAGQQDPNSANSGNTPPYNYFCNGTTGKGSALNKAYSTLSNEIIVQDAYSGIFNNGPSEIFAEALSSVTGFRNDGSGTTVWDWDHFMDPGVNSNLFQCSRNVVYYLFYTGTKPPTNPTGCPTS